MQKKNIIFGSTSHPLNFRSVMILQLSQKAPDMSWLVLKAAPCWA